MVRRGEPVALEGLEVPGRAALVDARHRAGEQRELIRRGWTALVGRNVPASSIGLVAVSASGVVRPVTGSPVPARNSGAARGPRLNAPR